MSAEIEALRQAMRAASVTGGGSYVEEGQHLLEIANCFVKQSAMEGKIKTTWICEFKVIESTNPTHEVGSMRSYVENPENQGWIGRWKTFLAAAIGADPNRITPELEKQIGDITVALRHEDARKELGFPENFLKGQRVRCQGTPGLSKVKKINITNKIWEPAPPRVAA